MIFAMNTKINECLLQFLYGYEITGELQAPEDVKVPMKLLMLSKTKVEKARAYAMFISAKLSTIDEDIKNTLKDYEFDRVSKIDLCILRIGFFLIDEGKSEIKDIINESIRLSKKFSTKEASKFVHAILDEKVKDASQREVSV